MQFVPTSRIERELAKVIQVPVPYHIQKDFPYPELGDRKFELLLYSLFREGIKSDWFTGEFDEVSMMPNMGSGGRDIVVMYQGDNRGVVRYSNKTANVSVPIIAREIIQFVLFSLSGQTISFERSNFRLFFAVAGGINKSAIDLVEDFNSLIKKESRLEYWIQEVLDTNIRLEGMSMVDVKEEVEDILSLIEIELILPEHLDRRMNEHPDIKSLFFGIEMVTSEQLLKKVVNQFNLKALDDQEAKRLLEKMEGIPEENRMAIGLLNFFGYHQEFLQFITGSDVLREIMMKGAEFKAEIDFALLDFLQERSEFYSNVLLADRPEISEIAKLAVPPYIFSRFAAKYVKRTNSKVLMEIVQNSREFQYFENASVEEIKKSLFTELGEAQQASGYDGDPRRNLRRSRLLQAADQFPTEEALSNAFDNDWKALNPTLIGIMRRLIPLLPTNPTILIEDMGRLDDESRFNKLLRRIRERFQLDKKAG